MLDCSQRDHVYRRRRPAMSVTTETTPAAAEQRGARQRLVPTRRRERSPNLRLWTVPTFATPAVVLYVGLVFLPLVLAIGYSLTNKNLLAAHTRYIGFANYRSLLSDDVFKQSLRTTAIMSALIVVLPNVLGLG